MWDQSGKFNKTVWITDATEIQSSWVLVAHAIASASKAEDDVPKTCQYKASGFERWETVNKPPKLGRVKNGLIPFLY